MKKLFAFVLALVMIMSLAATGFAAEKNDSITVTGTKTGETYELYKLFDLKVNDEYAPSKYTYTINSAWENFFKADDEEAGTEAGAGYEYLVLTDGAVTDITDAAALAKAAEKYAKENNISALKTEEAKGDNVVFDSLENGYYLITSTLGTVAMTRTTPDDAAVTVGEKNPEDTIVKNVKEDSTNTWGENNDAQVGDTVEFKSTASLVKNTTNVKIYDTMDSGLDYTEGSIQISGLTKGTEYAVEENKVIDNVTYAFVITFTENYLASLTADKTDLTLTYTAVLTDDAVVKDENGVAIVDQYNKTKITYGDKQSVTSQTKTTTHKSTVNKYAAGVENLAGAEFSLKKNGTVVKLVKLDDINYRVATATEIATEGATTDTFETVSTGDIVIWGLDSDSDYKLEEITAPDGYNKLSDEVKMEVNADNSSVTNVENKSGTELPSTGGMGTTLFYVVGGIMVLAAVVLLVTKKRMAVEG